MRTYPEDFRSSSEKKAIAAEIYGNRFHADQTLYEYMIEFLLVFVSPSDDSINPKNAFTFHDPECKGNLYYNVEPRMGLKRFIFFERNRKGDFCEIDKNAYDHLIEELKKKVVNCGDSKEATSLIESFQDLLHGYAVILRKRTWCAQAMLPVCPELVFCEAMPKKTTRSKLKWDDCINGSDLDREKIDGLFDFNKRNFLARGGELYYLHLLQGMKGKPDQKKKLESLLRYQLVEKGKKISRIASFVQRTWEEYVGYQSSPTVRMAISFIPENAYENVASFSVEELLNFMSCRMHPVEKLELLAKGIMVQVMRMLSVATTNYLGQERECWIMDVSGSTGEIVKKIASNSFENVQGTFTTAIGRCSDESDAQRRFDEITRARKDSFGIFKAKGKELQCIIPTTGPYERFSLPEDCIRFLVLSILKPKEKMTLDMFLDRLYERYRIVIGPVQFKRMNNGLNVEDKNLSDCFFDNLLAFQEFLKATGFLRDLSDATSIVENPFEEIEVGGNL